MTDITALAQRMKAAAEKATPGEWRAFTHPASGTYAIHTPKDKRCEDVIKWLGFDGRENAGANAKFVATANPANILALVEALEARDKQIAKYHAVLNSLAFVARRYLPDYDEHPEIQAADELLESADGIPVIEGEQKNG